VLASVACRNPGGGGRPTTTRGTTPVTTGPDTTEPGGGGGGGTRRGPDPTEASITATRGPFAISQTTVPRGNGFGGGTIYYPTDTSQGTFAGITVTPGFTALQSSISWYGPRLASQGFVVFTIDTNSTSDFPPSRATQMLAALNYLTTQSTAKSRVDPNRLAVMGWSMGGGGSLDAAKQNSKIKAVIPLAGWESSNNMSGVKQPALVVACQNDTIAPPAQHSQRFYDTLGSSEKAYMQINGSGHFCVTTANTTIARYSIAWLKRFVDNDTRYSTFICTGSPSGATGWKNTCPV
jgi:dienelactone hydrolase